MPETLAQYRYKPGTKLMDGAHPMMVVELAAGMLRDGATPSGGEDSVAVVSLVTGKASFMWAGTIVEPIKK